MVIVRGDKSSKIQDYPFESNSKGNLKKRTMANLLNPA